MAAIDDPEQGGEGQPEQAVADLAYREAFGCLAHQLKVRAESAQPEGVDDARGSPCGHLTQRPGKAPLSTGGHRSDRRRRGGQEPTGDQACRLHDGTHDEGDPCPDAGTREDDRCADHVRPADSVIWTAHRVVGSDRPRPRARVG